MPRLNFRRSTYEGFSTLRKRPIAAFFSDFAKAVALQLRLDPMPPERRALEELFNSGGPGWHWYPTPMPRRGRSGAAAQQRAARKLRNVRARASKR
jgi:ribosomal protein S21